MGLSSHRSMERLGTGLRLPVDKFSIETLSLCFLTLFFSFLPLLSPPPAILGTVELLAFVHMGFPTSIIHAPQYNQLGDPGKSNRLERIHGLGCQTHKVGRVVANFYH